MQTSGLPIRMPTPFADSGVKTTIPIPSQISVTPGRASFTDGFPPLTRTAIAAGGVPPYGTDFNGILNAITAALRWTAAGSSYPYDSTFSTAISGYPKGALLPKATFDGLWLNTVEGNTSNPDSAGAGWIDALKGRLLSTQIFSASGTYTPTPGTTSILVEMIGGGGAGGGAAITAAGQYSVGGGGGSGAYAKSRLTSGFSGAAVVVGSGGTPTTGSGGAGGDSSFGGAVVSAKGGAGGSSQNNGPNAVIAYGAAGGLVSASTGNLVKAGGQTGQYGIFVPSGALFPIGGIGAPSFFGGGGFGSNGTVGGAGQAPGAGGGGSSNNPSTAAIVGGAGAAGVVIIYEFA